MMNWKKLLIAGAIALSITLNWSIAPAAMALDASPLSGLITLKNLAKSAIPYQEAIANSKPTLLEFYADWCNTCQGMSGTIERLDRKYGDRVNLVMLNVDDPQWDNLAQEFKVTGIPQYNFLDAEENKIESFIGKVPQSILAQTFEKLIGS
jgi:thioredoxin-like negative regulator of GroEL